MLNSIKINAMRITVLIILISAIVFGYIVLKSYIGTFGTITSTNHNVWSEAGSFFGGVLGPVLAFLALLALLINIEIQEREFKGTRKVMSKQSFDSTFFKMIDLYIQNLGEVRLIIDKNHPKRQAYEVQSREAFVELHKIFYKFCIPQATKGDQNKPSNEFIIHCDAYKFFYDHYGYILGHYYRTIYHILKIIDSSDFDDEAKKAYSNILRCQISQYELTLLFYNCISNYGREKFLPLAQKYDLFKHLNLELLCDVYDDADLLDKSRTIEGEKIKSNLLTSAMA